MFRFIKCTLFISFLMLAGIWGSAQEIKILTHGTQTSLRGLCPVSDQVIWASGSSGYVGLSVDGGSNWKWMQVKGYEKTEFRDIAAFNEKSAVIMGITEPAVILRTDDSGNSWSLTFADSSKGAFFDAIDFKDNKSGILIGDPLDGRVYLASTQDGGKSWKLLNHQERPVVEPGEACFASSGSNIILQKKKKFIFITGGLSSHLYMGNTRVNLPLLQGRETTGANAIAQKNRTSFVVVGGDFMNKDGYSGGVCAYTKDGGKSWLLPVETCHGYRSAVEWIGKNSWITCGLNGVDISKDGAKHFKQISKIGYNACKRAAGGKRVFFAGSNGRVSAMDLED